MLALRPTCEHCDTSLPPHSLEARICSYECTFCATCVETVLANVCPNCGGGFVPRPIRPGADRVGGNYLGNHPACDKKVHRPVDLARQTELVRVLGGIPPHKR